MTTQWPPRSPFEALLSSPSGRKRARDIRDCRSISPSPTKRAKLAHANDQQDGDSMGAGTPSGDAAASDEDEEMLQLRLQAIEAKLKLKKLRQAKAKSKSQVADAVVDTTSLRGRVHADAVPQTERKPSHDSALLPPRSKSLLDVQVPLSPPERKKAGHDNRSPGRLRLGIDKGLTGKDVSLRRPPAIKDAGKRHSGYEGGLGGTASRETSHYSNASTEMPPPKSFSERIAESRASDRSRQEREDRLRRLRSTGFGIAQEVVATAKEAALAAGDNDREDGEDPFVAEARRCAPREFSRAEVLQSYNQVNGHVSRQESTAPDPKGIVKPDEESRTRTTGPKFTRPPSETTSDGTTTQAARPKSPTKNDHVSAAANPSTFESFSGFHLSRRVLPHALLTREFLDKKIYHIPDLLKTVKAPAFEGPDVEEDWVVLAIIASKSSPRNHTDEQRAGTEKQKPNDDGSSSNNNSGGRGKYMVLSLTDLKWELELFLFSTAFDRFWKLTPGTVIALLNPNIMPPPPHKRDTGRFSLMFGSSEETVLEIGAARDLGFCKSVKRDGRVCEQWVDRRHTDYCTFHIDASVRKTKAGRMEINSISTPFGPGGRSGGGGRGGLWGAGRRHGGPSRGADGQTKSDSGADRGLRREGPFQDRSTHSQVYVSPAVPGFGRSSASLLDDEDVDPDAFHRGYSKQERLRRQLVAQERERETVRKLGEAGSGMGGTYLRATATVAAAGASGARLSSYSSSSKDSGGRRRQQSPRRPHTSTGAGSTAGSSTTPRPDGTTAEAWAETDLSKSRSKASSVRLSPLKAKRHLAVSTRAPSASTEQSRPSSSSFAIPTTTAASSSTSTSAAKSILIRRRQGEGDESDAFGRPPTTTTTATTAEDANDTVRKARLKTRFQTVRGIKESGRESVGVVDAGGSRDDDDDGLDIVR
ncbi:MAG: hypothetical protein M1815_001326 [Lichina confinis]|nr:MAG: hypothetical protein M1815_001326 [Lichina confinis]